MRKVILYIAMSLDGYITDQHGRIDWLHGDNPTDEKTESYHHLLKHVDSVIMSETAFRMIRKESQSILDSSRIKDLCFIIFDSVIIRSCH